MRLIPVNYYGFTAMDRRFSSPMLPWIVSEIRKRDSFEKLSLGVEDSCLQAYNSDFEVQFSHKVIQMTRFSQADLDPCTFLYLLRDDAEQLLYCYLFQATRASDVSDLYQQMKEQSSAHPTPTRSLSSAANLTSLCVDISPSSSNFFEVLYIGKIKVWNKKVPETFIDDALDKFKAHDLEKSRRKLERLRSEANLRRSSIDSNASDTSSVESFSSTLQRSHSMLLNLSVKSPDIDRKVLKSIGNISEDTSDSKEGSPEHDSPQENEPEKGETQKQLPADIDDHNRTMVLQIDRTDLRLISPDRKGILLHKHHKEIYACVQGQVNAEHFGFVSREAASANTFVGYVFKCESSSVAGEAVGAISQALNNAETRPQRSVLTSCEHCPMVWFHKLCCEIENLTDKKTQAAIFRKIEQLDEEEQNVILTKFRGAETDSMREQNEFLMMLLRAHCEMKQGRHIHDTAENRSEFLNQYLGGSTIFMKAKRSLTNSFDHLLKRKGSKDDFSPILKDLSLPVTSVLRDSSPHGAGGGASDSEEVGEAAKTGASPERSVVTSENGPKSPMMDIFLKVGSSPKNASSEEGSPKQDVGSWRQAIFKRVVTPSKPSREGAQKRSREELRSLWKKSIHQAILLVRMEKENARLRAKQEESAVKRIKLEYDEMKTTDTGIMAVWDMITSKEAVKSDKHMLLHAIRQGVPRGKRGEVWNILAEQYCAKVPPIDTAKYPNYNVPYEQLLKQLTSHQHAILIDLGRTFPSHSYYSSPLGPGQLALFNLLKAYSLLDPEVGYCQGLSFVAGVLLLHMEESQAFFLLRHLMFRRDLRKQYLPDMVGLQIKLYQLSRLLHDQIPELYNLFDYHEVAPTLYAAPWLLTVFASQFPLGFVTRVFDLMFLENTDVVFTAALALLSHHKDNLLACDSFEEIMNYLKNTLPAIDKPTLDKIMKKVYTTDITKQLNEYQVEYQVLQEEMQSVQPQVEALHKLQSANKQLADQNRALMAQLELALSNVQRLEKTRTIQQASLNRLEMQNRGLEVTIATLSEFINDLIDRKIDVEIPGEVRRVLAQISFSERRKNENITNMLKTNTPRIMVKSLSTGKIGGIPNVIIDEENQAVLRANSLNTAGSKNVRGSFFSNSLQQKINNVKINFKVNDGAIAEDPPDDDNKLKEGGDLKPSPTNSIDSGVCTPSSPNKDIEHHPLSNCDVNFTYNGTRELRKVRNLRNMCRNSSPDMIGK